MTRLNIPLFVALAASILSAVPVDARDTLPHQRMIRKRGPSVGGPGPIGAAAVIGLHVRQVPIDPTGSASQSSTPAAASTTAAATSSASTSSAAASTTSAPTSSAAATTSSSSSSSAAATTTSSGGLIGSLTAILGSSTSATSSTVSSRSTTPPTSSAAPTSSASPTSQAPQPSSQAPVESPSLNLATPPPAASASHSQSVSVNYIYSTQVAEASASASAAAAKAKTEKITKNTIISLVVIAACIGGAIAIWTVIRKWKLSPSEKFDDRMQPIDWAPPPANGTPEDAIEEKSKHRRAGSGASHGSFTSGGVGQSEQGHGAKGGMYAESQYGHGYGTQPQDFPPPHDFTAGAAQPGGYGQYYAGQQYAGGPGYADLQRGPSMSESNYSSGANVSRGLSYSRGHGAYDSQSGAVPPMPNPYGGEYGHDDYNHPPVGQQPQAQGQAPYRAF